MINLSYPEAIEQITNKKFTITLEPPPPPPFMLGIKMQYWKFIFLATQGEVEYLGFLGYP